MGTSCTIVLSLEQKPKSVAQESAEYPLPPSTFQITVSQEASGVRNREGLLESSYRFCHGPYSQTVILQMACFHYKVLSPRPSQPPSPPSACPGILHNFCLQREDPERVLIP